MGAKKQTRQASKFTGVYSYTSDARRHQGRPDVCYYIRFKGADGKPVHEKVGWLSEGYSAALAAQVRNERLRSIRHGDVLPQRASGLTLQAAWREYQDKHGKALRGRKEDQSRWDAMLKPALAGLPLSSITPKTLAEFKERLARDGYAPQSVRHALALVRRVMNKAREWGLWSGESPFRRGALPKPDNARWRWLAHEDAHRLLEALAQRSLLVWRLALFSLHTGARAGEVLALLWQHVDIEARLVHILDAKAGSRAVFIDTTLAGMFKAMARGAPDAHVFTGRKGRPMSEIPKTFERTVEALGLNEGITDRRGRVVFHTLRHTFASWLAMDGVSMYEIAELLGQSEIEMAKRYAKLSPGQKRASVDRLDRRFRAATPAGHGSSPSRSRKTPPDPSAGKKPGRRS